MASLDFIDSKQMPVHHRCC